MKDKNVEILLQTPLLVITSRDEIREKPVLENILRVVGKVVDANAAGVQVAVKSIGSERSMEKNPHFSEVFIPYHKVDHIIIS